MKSIPWSYRSYHTVLFFPSWVFLFLQFKVYILFSFFVSEPDIFGLPSFFFLSSNRIKSFFRRTESNLFFVEPKQIFPWRNNLTIQTRTTALSKQVFVPKRGKKKYQHFFYPVNHLNQRKSPSATLVSKEIETDFNRRCFSRSRGKFPKVTHRSHCWVLWAFYYYDEF